MTVPDAKRLKDLELENSRLKKLLAESLLDIRALKVVTRGKGEPGSGAGGAGDAGASVVQAVPLCVVPPAAN